MTTAQALRLALELSRNLPSPGSKEAKALIAAADGGGVLSQEYPEFTSGHDDWWMEGYDGAWHLMENGKDVASIYQALRDAEARAEQPPPIPGGMPVWPLVLADLDAREQDLRRAEGDEIGPILVRLRKDMAARDAAGREKYNAPLTTNNGHDVGRDCYEEALDLCVYARQRLAETERSSPKYHPHRIASEAALDRVLAEAFLRYM